MRLATIMQQQLQRGARKPRVWRRFTVWMGATIPPSYTDVRSLARAVYALLPRGVWDEVELLLKAGEGGTWQSAFDHHPLAPSGPFVLTQLAGEAQAYGFRITPYVVVRARPAWVADEQAQIRACVAATGRCVLNVEPGSSYYNGPTEPGYVRGYLLGVGVTPSALEVCMIPRAEQVAELGGVQCLQAWTDPTLVGGASWECYDLLAGGAGATSLRPDVAIPRLDGWGVPAGPAYRVCVVQRSRIGTWAKTPWCAQGMGVWWLDGD